MFSKIFKYPSSSFSLLIHQNILFLIYIEENIRELPLTDGDGDDNFDWVGIGDEERILSLSDDSGWELFCS